MEMTSKEAVIHVIREMDVPSKYAVAKLLSDDTLEVQPIQISNYLKGKTMSAKTAKRFEEVFGITITDVRQRTILLEIEELLKNDL